MIIHKKKLDIIEDNGDFVVTIQKMYRLSENLFVYQDEWDTIRKKLEAANKDTPKNRIKNAVIQSLLENNKGFVGGYTDNKGRIRRKKKLSLT